MNNSILIVDHTHQATIEEIVAVAEGRLTVQLSDAAPFRQLINKGSAFLERLLAEQNEIYGVTTGYGDSCTVGVSESLLNDLPIHLYRYHGCGLGENLSLETARAVIVTRLFSLAKGCSGVTIELLKRLVELLQHDMIPVIPSEGSVGASGDLTPLSYLAAVLCGEREIYYQGTIRSSAEVHAELGMQPLRLRPKEGLALMNGTAVMTAIAAMAFTRANYLAQMAAKLTAMNLFVSAGNPKHFDIDLFKVKPHPGQQKVAEWIRSDFSKELCHREPTRIQDRYSLRCAPHVIGVLMDTLTWNRTWIENELNSSNDNPIIDPHKEKLMHGGHFYGGHIAMAMDSLKCAVANVADLIDRQVALVLDPKFNSGLPANLSGSINERACINHGFKAVQIAVSAFTAEALKLTMPASVFSRSTECHNQDKVSMGTISARDCIRILELTEQVIACAMMVAAQGVELRSAKKSGLALPEKVRQMQTMIRKESPYLDEDRALKSEIESLIKGLKTRKWELYHS